jgi:hypothetical protein
MGKNSLPIMVLILAALFGACQTEAENPSNNAPVAVKTPSALSETLQNYYKAAAKKDTAALRGLLSSSTTKEIAAMEKNLGKGAFDRSLEKSFGNAEAYNREPEFRNEKIEGNEASVELKEPKSGTWNKMYFTMENGQWKIDLLKGMEDYKKSN